MNDITVCVVGNLVREVEERTTRNGDAMATFRIASSTRRYDKATGGWVDISTHFFDVTCYRSLAQNVAVSLTKGMPVIVHGKLRSREVERQAGDRTYTVRYVDIDAWAVGPDLARGTASFTRVKRDAVVAAERRAIADALGDIEIVDPETGEVFRGTSAA